MGARLKTMPSWSSTPREIIEDPWEKLKYPFTLRTVVSNFGLTSLATATVYTYYRTVASMCSGVSY